MAVSDSVSLSCARALVLALAITIRVSAITQRATQLRRYLVVLFIVAYTLQAVGHLIAARGD
jgi:hypothetical protein